MTRVGDVTSSGRATPAWWRPRIGMVSAFVRRIRRRAQVREAVASILGARGARVVLVYHRIVERDTPRYEIVPTVPRELFRRQLHVLGELGRIEPLGSLLEDGASDGTPRFALTFDDDLGSHVDEVMPVLRELDLEATFFLSGRALHGLGGYWFERLEAMIEERGLRASASALGVSAGSDLELARACEDHPRARALVEALAPPAECSLTEEKVRELVDARVSLGFHTLHHAVLPALDDQAAREAVTLGRAELEALTGLPLAWFAYPHGRSDARIAALVREAGFTHAWTTSPVTSDPADDAHFRPRWDPLPVSTDHMILRLAQLLATRDPRG